MGGSICNDILVYIYIYRRGERERDDPFEHTNKMSRKNLVGAVKKVEIKEFKF